MRKHLQKLLLIVAMMVVPWVTQAQTFNYTCNFEDDEDTAGWVFVNGSQANQWFIGTATNNGGSHSLYISSDNGSSNTYNSSSTTFVYADQEFNLTTGGSVVSFDWKANGEGNYDYLRVFLAPTTVTLNAGSSPNGTYTSSWDWGQAALPSGVIDLSGAYRLNLSSSWQNRFVDVFVPADGNYRLVFAWANDGSVGNTPPRSRGQHCVYTAHLPTPGKPDFHHHHPQLAGHLLDRDRHCQPVGGSTRLGRLHHGHDRRERHQLSLYRPLP